MCNIQFPTGNYNHYGHGLHILEVYTIHYNNRVEYSLSLSGGRSVELLPLESSLWRHSLANNTPFSSSSDYIYKYLYQKNSGAEAFQLGDPVLSLESTNNRDTFLVSERKFSIS